MKIFLFCLLLPLCAHAQAPDTSIAASTELHRQQYKQAFLTNPRSPLTAADTAFLDFFPPSANWQIIARLVETPESLPFDMLTYSGKTTPYRQYGLLLFELNGINYSLEIYQNLRLLEKPEYQDYLFLPFKDESNVASSYGGGRYLDFRKKDLVETEGQTRLLLDFNKCYNPYCAYSDGYNCPVPPIANHLPFAVPAGEKLFLGEKKH